MITQSLHNKVCSMSHTILCHHVREMFILQLCFHSNVATLEKKNSIYTKTNGALSMEGFNNHKGEAFAFLP
jgi:hypothetical protein